MAQQHSPHLPHYEGWDLFTHGHLPVMQLFLYLTLPLSVIPPVMIYYAGLAYGGVTLPALNASQLQIICAVLFMAELAMTFVVAYVIQSLGEVIEIRPDYADAYKLAVLVPIPLWVAPLFLFVPNFILNLTVGAFALLISGRLIFYAVPQILKVKVRRHATLLSGAVLAAGLVAWSAMMYITLVTWSWVTSGMLLL
jgi:hypothetical protein